MKIMSVLIAAIFLCVSISSVCAEQPVRKHTPAARPAPAPRAPVMRHPAPAPRPGPVMRPGPVHRPGPVVHPPGPIHRPGPAPDMRRRVAPRPGPAPDMRRHIAPGPGPYRGHTVRRGYPLHRPSVMNYGGHRYVMYNGAYHRYRTRIYYGGGRGFLPGYYVFRDGYYYPADFIGPAIAAGILGAIALVAISAADQAALDATLEDEGY